MISKQYLTTSNKHQKENRFELFLKQDFFELSQSSQESTDMDFLCLEDVIPDYSELQSMTFSQYLSHIKPDEEEHINSMPKVEAEVYFQNITHILREICSSSKTYLIALAFIDCLPQVELTKFVKVIVEGGTSFVSGKISAFVAQKLIPVLDTNGVTMLYEFCKKNFFKLLFEKIGFYFPLNLIDSLNVEQRSGFAELIAEKPSVLKTKNGYLLCRKLVTFGVNAEIIDLFRELLSKREGNISRKYIKNLRKIVSLDSE